MKSYIFAVSVLCGLTIYAKDDLYKWSNAEPPATTYSAKPSPAALDSRYSIGQVGSAPICATDTECAELCPDDCCSLPPDHPDYCDGGPDPEPSWPPPPNASVPDLSAESSQVLITFERNTPPERIAKITRDLGVRIEQTMFDHIVVGSFVAGNRSMADLQTAAKKYPEVVAVEPSQKVKAQ